MHFNYGLWTLCPILLQLSAAFSTPSSAAITQPGTDSLFKVKPKIIILANATEQMFHEASVYHAPTKALWVNSDALKSGNGTRIVQRITGLDSPDTLKIEVIDHSIPNPIGGVHYTQDPVLGDVILFAAQGTKAKTPPAGVYALNPYPPYNSTLVIGSYGDYPYNSPDDVTVTADGTIWFTDPPYGYNSGNRDLPILPNQVYSYNAFTKDNRVVADGFGRPNGIAANAKGTQVYIGDTGAMVGNGTLDFQGPRTIYVYDRQGPMLGNRRVFAMPNALQSGPDGIKVDTMGNVWSGVNAEGVVVWNSEGTFLGSIELSGKGVAIGNIGFGEPGELFVCGGDRLYKILLSKDIVGVRV